MKITVMSVHLCWNMYVCCDEVWGVENNSSLKTILEGREGPPELPLLKDKSTHHVNISASKLFATHDEWNRQPIYGQMIMCVIKTPYRLALQTDASILT